MEPSHILRRFDPVVKAQNAFRASPSKDKFKVVGEELVTVAADALVQYEVVLEPPKGFRYDVLSCERAFRWMIWGAIDALVAHDRSVNWQTQ